MTKLWPLLRFFILTIFMVVCSKTLDTAIPKKTYTGGFQLQFDEPNSLEDRQLLELIKSRAEQIINKLNARMALPVDVPIVFTSKNQRESPEYVGRSIVYPYRMLRTIASVLRSSELKGKDLEEAVTDTAVFILVHEVVHALIDILSLPVLGPEEDAADCGATIILASLEGGAKIIDHAILFWRASSDVRSPRSDALADIHGLDLQRAYNLACWTYGQDVDRNESFRKNLPEHRAVRCAFEYFRLANSWNQVLIQNLQQK